MSKQYLTKNVYDACQERFKIIFDNFENVLVAFSTGKDSGVLLALAHQYAKKTGNLHKLAFYYQDYEAIFSECTNYAERCFNDNFCDVARKYWLCMPVKASCSVTMMQDGWTPWNPEEKNIWVRDFPKSDSLFTLENYPFPFQIGVKGFDFRIDFSKHFANKYGKTAVLIGIRADESLSRLAIFTSNQRVNMFNDLRYSTKTADNLFSFYPIYDWTVDDVWTANCKFGFDYNKTYDLYYKAGLSPQEMRIASPFHACGQAHLKLYKAIDPNMWGKMISRVNGVNFTGIYGGTTLMGWKNIQKPAHFTWKQYAEFLLDTLPPPMKAKYVKKIEKSQWHWQNQGGARDESFITQLEKEGVKMRRTGRGSNSCKVNTHKELIFIDEMMDDTSVDDFRKAPSWKRVCIAILKNDVQCQYMGFSRTKEDNAKRKAALEKYKYL